TSGRKLEGLRPYECAKQHIEEGKEGRVIPVRVFRQDGVVDTMDVRSTKQRSKEMQIEAKIRMNKEAQKAKNHADNSTRQLLNMKHDSHRNQNEHHPQRLFQPVVPMRCRDVHL